MKNRNSGSRRNPGNRHGKQEGQHGNHTQIKQTSFVRRKKGKPEIPVRTHSIPPTLRDVKKAADEKITYVIDTNVFMLAWDSLFKFEEHDVCIVGQVWEELDKYKKGKESHSMHARKVTREVDRLMSGKSPEELFEGILLDPPKEMGNGKPHSGKLIFRFSQPKAPKKPGVTLSFSKPDDVILMACLELQADGKRIVLITRDANVRVKARLAGIETEDYLGETTTSIEGVEDSYTGFHEMPKGFWNSLGEDRLTSGQKGSVASYTMVDPFFKHVYVNEFLVFEEGLTLVVVEKPSPHKVIAEAFQGYFNKDVWGINARNSGQDFALHLLMDPEVHAVCLAGLAGSGKTLLALAAGLAQVKDVQVYSEIIITRSTKGADEEIGFLPGTEEEKMHPWMGAIDDNLEVLLSSDESESHGKQKGSDFGKDATLELLRHRIKVKSLNLIKGRSFTNRFIIVDEAEDLSQDSVKKIMTRAGTGSKIVFLGNSAQIDNPYLTPISCGVSVLARTFADWYRFGYITLQQGERSEVATEAEKRL